MKNKRAMSCRPIIRAVPGPALRADMTAQARHYDRAVPGTGTKRAEPGRAWAVLLSAVPGPAHSARAKWPNIGWCDDEHMEH